jgi:dTDP-L-rhamnose 4-epimerase
VSSKILITGGAGFIGSHRADELLAHDWQVRALDDLTPSSTSAVNGPPTSTPTCPS